MGFKFDSVKQAALALKRGEMVILVDDKNRENEGDLIMAAQKASAKKLNFMSKQARGLICVPITKDRAEQLRLEKMSPNTDRFNTPFTVSVDAARGGSGISIQDRLLTIKTLHSKNSKPSDLSRPGHIFPLVAKEGGVLHRAGHTEGTIELLKIAKMDQVGVICEIMNERGQMAKMHELKKFAKKHSLKIVTLKDIIQYRLKNGVRVRSVAKTKLPTQFGNFEAHGYLDTINGHEYIALVKGKVRGKKNVLVRVHSGCITGDIFSSKRCDCNEQLHIALRKINKSKRGVLLYIPHHEGRGVGLLNKLRAYQEQDRGKDTVEANTTLGLEVDKRDYGAGAQILRDLGLSTIRILTNNPKKLKSLEGFGLKITAQIPLRARENSYNRKYLATKRIKLGHSL
ncbi:MAG TPA: GTP cyclohydrolase II [archaeon]|nr:GTP cyclohydrolase II [archaeon]